jgi:hypothetical protein
LAHQQGQWQRGLCGLDDSSRFILAGGEYAAATGEASIDLVREVLENYGDIRRIREIITNHGTQFFANKTDKMGNLKVHFLHSSPKTGSNTLCLE